MIVIKYVACVVSTLLSRQGLHLKEQLRNIEMFCDLLVILFGCHMRCKGRAEQKSQSKIGVPVGSVSKNLKLNINLYVGEGRRAWQEASRILHSSTSHIIVMLIFQQQLTKMDTEYPDESVKIVIVNVLQSPGSPQKFNHIQVYPICKFFIRGLPLFFSIVSNLMLAQIGFAIKIVNR